MRPVSSCSLESAPTPILTRPAGSAAASMRWVHMLSMPSTIRVIERRSASDGGAGGWASGPGSGMVNPATAMKAPIAGNRPCSR